VVKVGDRTVNDVDEFTVALRDRAGRADRCAARRPAYHTDQQAERRKSP